jgi:two-component system, chemotaxis family, sensor kinase Cph1
VEGGRVSEATLHLAEPHGDLAACDREPIHLSSAIQPHGALLALDRDLRVERASANAASFVGLTLDPLQASEPPGLETVLPPAWHDLAGQVRAWLDGGERIFLAGGLGASGRRVTALAQRLRDGGVLLEFEAGSLDFHAAGRLQARVQADLEQLGRAEDLHGLCALAAGQVRELTGFNRVLIYRFTEAWDGVVVAEDGDGALPSYLGLRFPASDIPSQARELYRLNRVRIIPDAQYQPQPIRMAGAAPEPEPLDLSASVLRSVSPVHLEYMRNMGTAASMSVSILVEGRLWGLISCHHATPRLVSLQVRNACDFLAQVTALQISALERTSEASRRIELAAVQAELLARMARERQFTSGLALKPAAWLALAGATGAAAVVEGEVTAAGLTPERTQILDLIDWLNREEQSDVFCTHELGERFPPARGYADVASGVLALRTSQLHCSYVLWFRPEVIQEVTWGGDPRKAVQETTGRLTPRTSFEQWKEKVRGRATPWESAVVETARAFRHAILNVVLRQAEERAELAGELQRSNRELEAFSYSVSHDLRAPFRHIVGYAELLQEREDRLDETSGRYVRSIRDSAISAARLVDDLLQFSKVGRATLSTGRVDMNKLVAEARRSLEPDLDGREIDWRLETLPPAFGDATMLRQVLVNLISNAAKYTRPRPKAQIAVYAESSGAETTYVVADNGVGFDMAYAGKLFGVFQRLHRAEEFEGTGIGLAIAQRVVERHGGRIWAEGAVDRGASFRFALPRVTPGELHG